MLYLQRRAGEKVMIGDDTEIVIKEIRRGVVSLGFEAPSQVKIFRREVYMAIRLEGDSRDPSRKDGGA